MEITHIDGDIENERKRVKRPPNAYFLFCREQRPILKDQYPDKILKDLNKILGEMWKEMPSEQKTDYKTRAFEENQKFKEQHPDYHYERSKSKKIINQHINTDPNYLCDLSSFVTDKYTIDQLKNFMKPGETTLNYQYNDEFIHP